MDPALSHLVSEVARVERDRLPAPESLQQTRFLAHARRRHLVRRSRGWLSLTAAVVLGASGYVFWPASGLGFDVEGTPGAVGDFLVAPANSSLLVDFSDGSRLNLQHEARARVLDLDAHGARLMLERGSLGAKVVHDEDTDWQVDAGPFRVHVVGTRFEVTWDPKQERFTLELSEGSVAVSGPHLQERCLVPEGARLQVSLRAGQWQGACVANSPPVANADAPALPPAEVPPPEQAAAATPAVESSTAPSTTWQQLARAGDHRAAWAEVAGLGFGTVKARARLGELMLLADLARLSGHAAPAAQALLDVRQRFPGSPEAGEATFLLGRVSADQQGAPARGALWFSRYLAEQPNGAFAAEALGRLMDCQRRAGQLDKAQLTARTYLQSYPRGPYAALAKHLTDGLDASRARSKDR